MPSSAYVTHSRYEETLARETLLANIPARVIRRHFDRVQGWRNTKTSKAALAYIRELEAAKLRLEVENGWLTEDIAELVEQVDKVEGKMQEKERQNGLLHELLEERMKADEEGAKSDDEVREGRDDVGLADESAKDKAGEDIKQ